MHIRRISVAKYPYPFKQGNYYPYPIHIRETCGYPQNIYPRIHIRASLPCITMPRRAGVKTLQTQDTSDLRHFGTGAEVFVGTGAEMSVRHFGTEVSSV